MHRTLTQRRNIWYQRKLFCIFVSECTADMLSLHMDSRLVETSLHGQQSWGVEEHSLMLAGLCQPSNGCNCPHNTWTSGPGGSSQCKIEPEGEYVYILLTFLLRRIITGVNDCYLLDDAATGTDCETSTAGWIIYHNEELVRGWNTSAGGKYWELWLLLRRDLNCRLNNIPQWGMGSKWKFLTLWRCFSTESWKQRMPPAASLVRRCWGTHSSGQLQAFEAKSICFVVDIDLRVIGLLKTVTFAGAVTFSGAETEDIAQWVNLVGSGSWKCHGIIINSLYIIYIKTVKFQWNWSKSMYLID